MIFSAIQLLLFVTPPNFIDDLDEDDAFVDYSRHDRFVFIKKWLVDNEWMTPDKFSHPSYMKVLDLWKQHVESPKYNGEVYAEFKKYFIEIWGAPYFDNLLMDTYFFHENRILVRDKINSYFRY